MLFFLWRQCLEISCDTVGPGKSIKLFFSQVVGPLFDLNVIHCCHHVATSFSNHCPVLPCFDVTSALLSSALDLQTWQCEYYWKASHRFCASPLGENMFQKSSSGSRYFHIFTVFSQYFMQHGSSYLQSVFIEFSWNTYGPPACFAMLRPLGHSTRARTHRLSEVAHG